MGNGIALDRSWGVFPGGVLDSGMTGGCHPIFGKRKFLGTILLNYGYVRGSLSPEKRKGDTGTLIENLMKIISLGGLEGPKRGPLGWHIPSPYIWEYTPEGVLKV